MKPCTVECKHQRPHNCEHVDQVADQASQAAVICQRAPVPMSLLGCHVQAWAQSGQGIQPLKASRDCRIQKGLCIMRSRVPSLLQPVVAGIGAGSPGDVRQMLLQPLRRPKVTHAARACNRLKGQTQGISPRGPSVCGTPGLDL